MSAGIVRATDVIGTEVIVIAKGIPHSGQRGTIVDYDAVMSRSFSVDFGDDEMLYSADELSLVIK